jgi:sugar/nucleoside kinase (ribokinase family)
MYDVSLYGHLTFDRIFDGFKKDTCIGSMGNVWYNLTKINPSLKINLEPTDIGEALILVNREKSERTSVANLNMKSKEPLITESKWNHILYINALSDVSFISNIKKGFISADICRGNSLSNLDILKHIDFLFISDEDVFMEMSKLCEIIKGGVILHSSSGSSYYNKDGFGFKINVDVIDNVNVNGCGDMLASYFIDSYLKFNDLKKSIKNAHMLVTKYLMEKNK